MSQQSNLNDLPRHATDNAYSLRDRYPQQRYIRNAFAQEPDHPIYPYRLSYDVYCIEYHWKFPWWRKVGVFSHTETIRGCHGMLAWVHESTGVAVDHESWIGYDGLWHSFGQIFHDCVEKCWKDRRQADALRRLQKF